MTLRKGSKEDKVKTSLTLSRQLWLVISTRKMTLVSPATPL